MAIHPIEFRYGTPEMKRIWEEENKLQRMLDVESALAQHGKDLDKTLKSQVKDELSIFKKMTKKVKYETCSQEEFETIKQAKIQLENTAGFLLSM